MKLSSEPKKTLLVVATPLSEVVQALCGDWVMVGNHKRVSSLLRLEIEQTTQRQTATAEPEPGAVVSVSDNE